MKPECNINMKALTNIVDGMLEEKNRVGRKVFEDMTNEGKLPANMQQISNSMQNFFNDMSNFSQNPKSETEKHELKLMLFHELGGTERMNDETSNKAKTVVDLLFNLYGI